MSQVFPFGGLFAPGVFRHALRCDDQHRSVLHVIIEEQVDGGQGRHCLAGPHAPEQGTGIVLNDPVNTCLLVGVWLKIHRVNLHA